MAGFRSNSKDVGQTDPGLLVIRNGYSADTGHKLTLPLLVLRFHLIDDVYPTFAADYLIVWTDFLHTGTDFHPDLLLMLERRTAS